MKKTIALLFALTAPLTAAPVIELAPVKVEAVTLYDREAGRSAKMVLAEERLDIEIAGPLAHMTVEQTWRYDDTWQSPGDEASQRVRASHLSALFDYWITEDGKVHKGVVRDARSAKAEYAANLAQRRDPGLVEWIGEGLYDLKLYPVPQRGIKKQAFTLIQALPVRPDGRMELSWYLPVYAVEKCAWSVRVRGEGQASGTVGPLASGWKKLDFTIASADVAARMPRLAWRGDSGLSYLQLSPAVRTPDGRRDQFLACIGDPGTEDALAARTGLPRADVPVGSPVVPEAWLYRLKFSARALRLELDHAKTADALAALRAAHQPGPGVVLFANPFTTQSAIDAGWKDAEQDAQVKQRAAAAPAVPAAPGLFSGLSFEVPTGIAAPNFKAARERSNVRACFANQKTVMGALEMYNLDKNTNVMHTVRGESAVVRGSWPAAGAEVDTPPAGVEWSSWRDPRRMDAYRDLHRLPRDVEPWFPAPRLPVELKDGAVAGGPDTGEAYAIPRWVFDELKSGGYLQSIPQDPGQGPDTQHHYLMTGFGNGIACLIHGTIEDGGKTSPYEQFVQHGVTSRVVLSTASRELPGRAGSYDGRRSDWPFLGWLVVFALIAAGACALALCCYLFAETEGSVPAAARAALWASVRWLFLAVPALILGPLALVALFWSAVRFGETLGALAAIALHALAHEK
jgi:hypothetical protein